MFWNTIEEWIKGLAYAAEPQRLLIVAEDQVVFEGQREAHILLCVNGVWACDCASYWPSCMLPGGGWCRHTVAVKCILAVLRSGLRLPVRHAATVH